MLSTVLGLFTGSNKWLYIALAVLALTCISLGSLSISLYGDKQALHVKVQSAKEALEKLAKEHKEKIEALEKKHAKLQHEKEDLQDTLSRVEALSEKLKAEAKRNAELGVKRQNEIKKAYEERLKRFEERVRNVQDYGESDSSIVDSAGI